MDQRFKVADAVTWESQSQGAMTQKLGHVVQVVQPGQQPLRDAFPSLYTGAGVGMGRKGISYVVKLDRKPGLAAKYYWPRESALDVP